MKQSDTDFLAQIGLWPGSGDDRDPPGLAPGQNLGGCAVQRPHPVDQPGVGRLCQRVDGRGAPRLAQRGRPPPWRGGLRDQLQRLVSHGESPGRSGHCARLRTED